MTAHHLDRHSRINPTDARTPRAGRRGGAQEAHMTVETSPSGVAPVPHYAIRVRGHLAPRWADWFDGMTVTSERDGTTAITGPVTDQAQLHGLLRRIGDLGLPLVSLTSSAPDAPGATDPTCPAHA
jgi:hypothetical protein